MEQSASGLLNTREEEDIRGHRRARTSVECGSTKCPCPQTHILLRHSLPEEGAAAQSQALNTSWILFRHQKEYRPEMEAPTKSNPATSCMHSMLPRSSGQTKCEWEVPHQQILQSQTADKIRRTLEKPVQVKHLNYAGPPPSLPAPSCNELTLAGQET